MLNSSIGRKFLMALSGVFLIIFLTQHLIINITSVFPDNGKTFNMLSHFMGSNWLVQFVLQPTLILGVVFHFSMGIYLEIQNQRSRQTPYIKYSNNNGSTWASRNMIISGLVVLSFLIMHFYDFWVPEIIHKYMNTDSAKLLESDRYFSDLQSKFQGESVRVSLYCASFILLGLHLVHGFASSMQSIGLTSGPIKLMARVFSITITIGFVFIAIFHYFSGINKIFVI